MEDMDFKLEAGGPQDLPSLTSSLLLAELLLFNMYLQNFQLLEICITSHFVSLLVNLSLMIPFQQTQKMYFPSFNIHI
jgi:hypothetical protein